MVTAQDIFPKVGNDPLYYSEINRFGRAPYHIKSGSFTAGTVGSQTGASLLGYSNAAILGSVLVAGSINNPSELLVDFYASRDDVRSSWLIGVSGASSYVGVAAGSITGGDWKSGAGIFKALIGSPMAGWATLKMLDPRTIENTTINTTTDYNTHHLATHLNTGSPFVVFFGLTNLTNAANFYAYTINAMGGAYA